jgi:mono/diheme cytochrome c family protein
MRSWGARKGAFALAVFVAVSGVNAPSVLAAPATPADNRGFSTIQAILTKSCADCHDWTGSWESVTGGGRVVPGDPEKSILYRRVSTDEMPAAGEKLGPEQKAFIRAWILAGAPSTDQPLALSKDAGTAPLPAATAATPATAPAPTPAAGFLLFPSKVAFHGVTGFTSTGLLLAAGVVGGIHFLNMMDAAHAYRDSIGFTEGDSEAVRAAEIEKVWAGDSALRWWHVGLLISGETLYLGDAVTGISMMTTPQPGKLTKHDIHRYLFFTHAALMAAQIGLGFAESYALSTGQHDLMIGLGAAHTTIGIAIPLVMLGAGLENLFLTE